MKGWKDGWMNGWMKELLWERSSSDGLLVGLLLRNTIANWSNNFLFSPNSSKGMARGMYTKRTCAKESLILCSKFLVNRTRSNNINDNKCYNVTFDYKMEHIIYNTPFLKSISL